MKLITDNLQKIFALCQQYKVRSLSVFGSILTNTFNENSDVDFSATFNHNAYPVKASENFLSFYIALQELIGKSIDLIDEEYIINPYFKEELTETKKLIYG